MNNRKIAMFAIPMLAVVMFMGAIVPAYAASTGNNHVNEKTLYAENDDDSFLDFVEVRIEQTQNGPVATADVFVEFVCSTTTVLTDGEYEWGKGEAWVSFDAGDCGQVDITWTGVGPSQKFHVSDAGESTCDETGFKGTLNASGKATDTAGNARGFPINHTVGSTTTFGDGFSVMGTLNTVTCEATSGQRP